MLGTWVSTLLLNLILQELKDPPFGENIDLYIPEFEQRIVQDFCCLIYKCTIALK
jgi:hypothetical protein